MHVTWRLRRFDQFWGGTQKRPLAEPEVFLGHRCLYQGHLIYGVLAWPEPVRCALSTLATLQTRCGLQLMRRMLLNRESPEPSGVFWPELEVTTACNRRAHVAAEPL